MRFSRHTVVGTARVQFRRPCGLAVLRARPGGPVAAARARGDFPRCVPVLFAGGGADCDDPCAVPYATGSNTNRTDPVVPVDARTTHTAGFRILGAGCTCQGREPRAVRRARPRRVAPDRARDAGRAIGADRRPRGRHGPQVPADRGGRAQAAGETRAARPGPGPGLRGPVGRGRAGVRPLPPAVQHERRSGATVRRARPCRRRASGAAGSTAAPAGSPPGRPSGTTTRPARPRLDRVRPPADR